MRFTLHTALLIVSILLSQVPARADTIAVTYSLTGGPIADPVLEGTTLTLDGAFTGSILSGSMGLNMAWNPVNYADHSQIDLTTALLSGTINIVFANGSTLFGTVSEDVAAIVMNNMGPYTQTLTFTGGTGAFAGASGSLSGIGVVPSNGPATVQGSGTINAPAIPEPAPAALLLSGLALCAIAALRSHKPTR